MLLARSIFSRPRRKSRIEERLEVLGLSDGPTFRFVDAMLHAAKAHGKVHPEELAFIAKKARDVTALDYSLDHIRWALDHTDTLKKQQDFERFGLGLTEAQARVVLRAALAVVAADGRMAREEHRFITRLAAGLMLESEDVEAILNTAPERTAFAA